MWFKIFIGVIDLVTTIDLIKDIKENGWNWRRFFWILMFIVGICGSALLITNGFPVLGTLGLVGVIVAGFVLIIRRVLLDEKNAPGKCAEGVQETEAGQPGGTER